MAGQASNHVILAGTLRGDPELHTLADGTRECKLHLIVNTCRWSRDTGEWQDKPNVIDVTVGGAQGENVAGYLENDHAVVVQGHLNWREWDTAAGEKRETVEVVAENIHSLEIRDNAAAWR